MKNAIVLCSGGIDSVTTAYRARNEKYNRIILLFFNYKQKSADKERKCVIRTAKDIKADFREIKLPELGILSTSLINKQGKIKKMRLKDLKDTRKEGNKWYVPFRNAIFLSYAIAFAESLYIKEKEKYDLLLGFKSNVGEGYPDTSSEFVKKFEEISSFSKAGRFKIITPFINKEKEDIIAIGKKLGIDFKNTMSCYVGNKEHCGICLACRLRQEGFYWANIKDPTNYKEMPKDSRFA